MLLCGAFMVERVFLDPLMNRPVNYFYAHRVGQLLPPESFMFVDNAVVRRAIPSLACTRSDERVSGF